MTEYGVQTNNLFEMLNENGGAKPKAKPAAPAGQQQQAKKKAQAPKPQPAKQAQAPKKPAEQKPVQAKPVAATAAPVAAGDEGFKTVGRSGQSQASNAPQPQQGAPTGAARAPQRPRTNFPQGSGPSPQGDRRPGQGGGQFRQGGPGQGQSQGQFRQGGQGQGQGQGQFRQGGQGQGQFRQGGGQFRQGGQGQGQFRQGGGRRDESDRRFDSFEDREHTHTLPNKISADGPRQKEDHGNHPVRAGGNRREFDRISGTGRAPNEQKRGGGGPGNWGKPGEDELKAEDDVKAEIAAGADGAVPTPDGAEAPKKKNKKNKKEDAEEDKDKKDELPDEKMVLFDDYMKEKTKKNKVKVSLPAARQAGEGDKENPEWATATKLDRVGEEVVFFSDKAPVQVAQPKGEKKKLSKSQFKKKKERKKAEAAKLKLEKDNVVSLFDFTAKKEPEREDKRERGDRSDRRERGGGRGGAGGPQRGAARGGPRGSPKGDGQRAPRPHPAGNAAPKKFPRSADAPQFDDSSFPALQLGP